MQDQTFQHEKFMKTCFKLALKGEGKTSPNPMVGAILVNKQGKIVAKGWHKGYGLDHAEVDCIKNYEILSNKNNMPTDYSNLTMYVNLEPCNHYGKTPPCADLIIKKGIKKVVIASLDPNPKHSGGAKKLKNAQVEVIEGILKNEAIKLNEVFFKNAEQNKPFVAIKTATTLDGKIATKTGSSKWITSKNSRNYVQKIRRRYDAILTSSSTVIKDNPSLTVRDTTDKTIYCPTRVVIDSSLKTNPNSKVYNNNGAKVFIIYNKATYNKSTDYPKNVKFIKISVKNGKIDLQETLKKLYENNISSILLEAGGTLCGAFLKDNLVDKIYHFIAPKILGDKNAINFIEGFEILEIKDCRNFKIATTLNINPDILMELYPINFQFSEVEE